jgi:LuxR family maltose regulon positive regulatory protein
MPKVPAYTLSWLPLKEVYELYRTQDREALRIVPGSPEWFAWLEQVSSFAFVGKSGHYSARKEAKQRGDGYWSAHLATSEHLTKRYLGKSADLTLARLEHIAGTLHTQSETQVTSLLFPGTGADNEGGAARRPLLPRSPEPLAPFLATKLRIPRPRPHLVLRSHLISQIEQGMDRSLMLVSAPAGFGKTTLLAQWLAESGTPAAWVSLGPEDNDPTSFLSYVIAALQTLDAQLGATALALLRTPQPPSPETVIALLTNELTGRDEGDLTLVLDDYHVITAESIQRGMTFLLEHLPPQLHLILAVRADPPLPLARLRAQGQLTEVRTADMRFGTDEAGMFLREVMGLDLPFEAIAILEQRTEGWIAGLQLAALSLRGRADVPGFLDAFSGSHRYVLDYLSEEVLARLDDSAQQFLLHTCILERLSGPLCDAVRELEGSQAMLEALERANLFVVPLDDERRWYRYHHLFAEMLRNQLQQISSALFPILHRRASAWYEQNALPAEAVQHALAIPDVERATSLIETIAFPLVFQGQLSTVHGWMTALPETLVRTRPLLCIQQASYLMFTGQLHAAEARLRDSERGFWKELPAEQGQLMRGYALTIRSGIANLAGETMQGVSLARQALRLLPETEVFVRMGALVTAVHAYLVSGDVTSEIERELTDADALIRSSGNLLAVERSTTLLGRLYVLQGRLRQASTAYEQVRQALPEPDALQTSFGSLFYHFALGDLLREWNDLETAERHLGIGMALVNEPLTLEPFVAALGYSALARLEQARGNSHAALATLDALAHVAQKRHFAPHLMTAGAAVRAQLELAQGNLVAAIRWADSCGLSVEDENLSYPRENEYLVLARVRIAQARDDPATLSLPDVLGLLDRLLLGAEPKARMNSVLEILVLRALAQQAQGNRTAALATLERALLLAEPEGYMRLFLDEGTPMLALLRLARARGMVPGYVATLLSAFGEHQRLNPALHATRSTSFVEPFTEREREVLQLLLEGASNREIARHLVISVNTVKKHVYNICGKLGVQSRAHAIVRARTLNLL